MNDFKQSQRMLFRLIYVFTVLVVALPAISMHVFARSPDDSGTAHEMQRLEEGETLDGPGFFSGDIVHIDGTVNGTTFAAGQEVQINGTINGSLFAAGQTVIINGEVTGNVYGAGQTITMGGQSDQDAFFTGASITIDQEAQLGRDLFLAGSSLRLQGPVPRHFIGAGQQITVDSTVGGNTLLDTDELTLEDSAVIEGDLRYSSPDEANMNAGATVNGQTDWNQTSREQMRQEPETSERVLRELFDIVWSILGALLVWFLVKIWRPNFWMKTIRPIASAPLKTMGIGLLALLVTPLMVILALITVIGIPLAFITLALYLICLYLAKIVVAVFIGSWLTNRFKWRQLDKEIWIVLMGLLLLELIDLIPFVGFLVGILVAVTGLGALILSQFRRPAPAPAPAA